MLGCNPDPIQNVSKDKDVYAFAPHMTNNPLPLS